MLNDCLSMQTRHWAWQLFLMPANRIIWLVSYSPLRCFSFSVFLVRPSFRSKNIRMTNTFKCERNTITGKSHCYSTTKCYLINLLCLLFNILKMLFLCMFSFFDLCSEEILSSSFWFQFANYLTNCCVERLRCLPKNQRCTSNFVCGNIKGAIFRSILQRTYLVLSFHFAVTILALENVNSAFTAICLAFGFLHFLCFVACVPCTITTLYILFNKKKNTWNVFCFLFLFLFVCPCFVNSQQKQNKNKVRKNRRHSI